MGVGITPVEIGALIRSKRVSLRISKQELALLTGLTPDEIYQVECGFSVWGYKVRAIAPAIHCKVSDLWPNLPNATNHGFYSPAAETQYGSAYWANEFGEPILLTHWVPIKSYGEAYPFPDKVYRGPVTHFVREGAKGIIKGF